MKKVPKSFSKNDKKIYAAVNRIIFFAFTAFQSEVNFYTLFQNSQKFFSKMDIFFLSIF